MQFADRPHRWRVRSATRATSFAELVGRRGRAGARLVGAARGGDGSASAADELGLDAGDQVTLTASVDDGITQPVTLRRQQG